MFRRLGQKNYRAESPGFVSDGSVSLSTRSDVTIPNVDYTVDDASSQISSELESPLAGGAEKICESAKDHRIVEKPEIATIEANICKKENFITLNMNVEEVVLREDFEEDDNTLNTIVNLVHEFSTDALGLRESADDLLDELRTKIRPYLINLDIDMSSAESILRYNIDRSNISESRIDWLLTYTKYQVRVLTDFSEMCMDTLDGQLEESRLEGNNAAAKPRPLARETSSSCAVISCGKVEQQEKRSTY
ncbi:hypothetical protein ANCCAN_24675 [Ancylostoma caninum]|uniref:Uncharacterized protein n=1 Tax=Ancylostoma caninum TaxID=29170 RepID=A0A368FBW1_ANCCA|nr:hypothetical protein ANCCAN_24675 [Ancylostoma caninum]